MPTSATSIITLILLAAFMVFEVTTAFVANSLSLLADAGHMLADVGAIVGSLVAIRMAARPATRSHTYGLQRAEILAAAGNAITLLLVSALVTFEAVQRLIHPATVHGGFLIVVAGVGVAVNLVATLTLSRANRSSLNIEGAYRHILTDLYGFIGTVIAGRRDRGNRVLPCRLDRLTASWLASWSRPRWRCSVPPCAFCSKQRPTISISKKCAVTCSSCPRWRPCTTSTRGR